MKKRIGFVSNSSSTAFWLINTSNSPKDLISFVSENLHLLDEFLDTYDYTPNSWFSREEMIRCASIRNEIFNPGQKVEVIFGDEDGDVLGHVFDYMLREGGISENFRWGFKENLR